MKSTATTSHRFWAIVLYAAQSESNKRVKLNWVNARLSTLVRFSAHWNLNWGFGSPSAAEAYALLSTLAISTGILIPIPLI
ncbi:hypothetical protein L1987_54472 [Smallanthus sonchifolius]|uniref:Uncharacterized protein n=1 Tax=Smallanthus sonchifolius TaxID=185202 RepID=A0ACB9E6Z5_9ASTR|nr:hypothetical protein L1987_54472 [Smallanthus sonchifolius]